MTAVLESTADAREGDKFAVHRAGSSRTAARRDFDELIDRYRPLVLEAVRQRPAGFPLRMLGEVVPREDLSAADSGRIADALAEAMLRLVSDGSIALTVDQKLVASAAS